jgi:hypothetical protein
MDEAAAMPPSPPDPAMEIRVSRIEADVGELRQDVRGLRDDLVRYQERVMERFASSDRDNAARFASLERELARLSGQVSQLPTTWTMATTFVSIVGVVAALGFAVARLLGRT